VEKKLPLDLMSAEIQKAARGRVVRLMFQDEARFGRINDPRYCWAPAPFRPVVKSAVIREFTYAFAAVSPMDGVLDSLVLPEVSTETMNLFLEEVASRHHEEFIVMILDGAGWHTAKKLNIPENMHFHFLPPYSPELNPTENLWDELREKGFANRAFNSMTAVEDQLVDQLACLEKNPQRVHSITGWPWIVNLNLNAK
jgi:transposase